MATPYVRCVILFLISRFLTAVLYAEQPAMRLFTTADGLVRNWVGRIHQDSQGRLWFCTAGGLSLFDGQTFTNYRVEDGLPDLMVNDLAEVGPGTYLLATGAGLAVFRPRTLRPASFESVAFQGSTTPDVPQVLLQSKSGDFYCGTAQGNLYLIRRTNLHRAEKLRLGNAAFGNYGIEALAETQDGSLWAGGGQLVRLAPDGQINRWAGNRQIPYRIRALMIDMDGLLWAAGSGGMSKFDPRSRPVHIWRCERNATKELGVVTSLYEDRSRHVWVGTLGLLKLLVEPRAIEPRSPAVIEPWSPRAESYEQTSLLGSQYISAIVEDSADNLWISLGNIGAARLKPGISQYSTRDGLEAPQIQSIFETLDGSLYAISGIRHTLNRFDGRRFHPIPLLTTPDLRYFGWGEDRVMLQDRAGEWWAATGEGLLRYPKVDKAESLAHTLPKARYFAPNGLPDDAVLRIFEDAQTNIWVGTAGGIVRWLRATQSFKNYTSQLKAALGHSPSPLSFAIDQAGSVWIGFSGGGLARFRNEHMEVLTKGVPPGSINALLADHAGRLWVASSHSGLALISDPLAAEPLAQSWQREAAIRGQQLYALAEDRNGRIYVAGGQGVDRFDPATQTTDHFDVNGGLPLGEIQRLHTDRSGAIWFASNFGVSRLLPDSGKPSRPADPVIYQFLAEGTRVAASDEGISSVGRFSFPADWNAFEIAYGSTSFATNENVSYRYRLLGLDSSWHASVFERSIRYGGLGPGRYRFEVEAVNSLGFSSRHTANIDFSIAAHFWRTWWFSTLAVFCLAAAAFLWHRSKIKHAIALERIRSGFAADLHDDLGSGLAEIAIMSEVAKQNGNQAGVLDDLAARARELRESLVEIVWSADPRRDSLHEFLQKCRQIAVTLCAGAELEFHVRNSRSLQTPLSPLVRRNLIRLYKEALTNVARHARSSRTAIDIAVDEDSLKVKISDNGRGFRGHNGGNGLSYMRERAELMRADFSIASRPAFGTVVEVAVPLKSGRSRRRFDNLK